MQNINMPLQLNTGQYGSEYRGRDLKVEKAWMQGLTGCNVTVGIVDDGMYAQHTMNMCAVLFYFHFRL